MQRVPACENARECVCVSSRAHDSMRLVVRGLQRAQLRDRRRQRPHCGALICAAARRRRRKPHLALEGGGGHRQGSSPQAGSLPLYVEVAAKA